MARITDWDGIQRTPFGYIVRVSVSPFPRRTKRLPTGSKHDEMIRWRNSTRQALERSRPRAAQAGTIAADVTRYLAQWGTGKHPHTVAQRARHLRLFAQVFGSRLRATLTTQEIEAQLARGSVTGCRSRSSRRSGATTPRADRRDRAQDPSVDLPVVRHIGSRHRCSQSRRAHPGWH